MKAMKKWGLSALAICCVAAGLGVQAATAAAQESAAVIRTEVVDVNKEGLDDGNCFVMNLGQTDFMTADEWSNGNFKWVNAEEISNRASIDRPNQNVCNAPLDLHLDEYNFEEYIFLDGVSLAEFSKSNSYRLIANKRQRVDTLSLDFASGVLQQVDKIEIKEGCQFPTLAYSYFGDAEYSRIEVTEDVAFENNRGTWYSVFIGYQEGAEYAGDEDNFKLSLDTYYRGHTTVALDAYTDFFQRFAVQGEFLDHKALVSLSNTEQGNIMILHFVNPIDARQFNRLHLRVYINHQIDVRTYNLDSVTMDSLGTALESYTVGGGQFSYLTLKTQLYADDSGQVHSIVFEFAGDCEPQRDGAGELLYDAEGRIIRDTFFFVSFHVDNAENEPIVDENSLMIVDGGDAYDVSFRFNYSGVVQEGALDTSKVTLNGVSVAQILKECTDATAAWYCARGIYQINLSIPKSYDGAAKIKNAEYGFSGNNLGVVAGLVFPDGYALDTSYTCHLFVGENLLDVELVKSYEEVKVESVRFSFIEDSKNLNFTLYFSGAITASPYNHACEREEWRGKEDVRDIIHYDEGSANIFLKGGYKASLLDNVLINGKTIGDWHAQDAAALTNVQVHYGVGLEMNRMDVRFEKASPTTYNQLYAAAESGEGITVQVLAGLKFMTNRKVEKTQTFVMEGGAFDELLPQKPIHVYFDGAEVQNGQIVTVETAVSAQSIFVAQVEDYELTCVEENGNQVYIITYGDGQTFTFSVKQRLAEPTEESGGCASMSALPTAFIAVSAAALLIGKRRRETA